MAVEVTMPKMGQTMTEGTIVSWQKQSGDKINKGDILFKVENDKTVLDVEAEHSGVLLKIVAKEGDLVPCGQIIAYIGEPGEQGL